jgi:serine-type D-Ala-D-Ala endopeptidase (penicillin-binding protein 7)
MKKLLILCLTAFAMSANASGAYALYDFDSMSYVVVKEKREACSIASITKMFTAITVIKSGVDLNEKVKVKGKSSGRFNNGTYVSRMDLLKAAIISSDNRAAESLANAHPGGFDQYIQDVNNYLSDNSMYDTRIVDATGLLAGNTSTPGDLVQFLHIIKDDTVILSIAGERSATVTAPRGKKQVQIPLRNTNPDIFKYDNVLISKTGFTSKAGRCVLMLVEQGKILYAVVVLGQPNPKVRSQVVSQLIVSSL